MEPFLLTPPPVDGEQNTRDPIGIFVVLLSEVSLGIHGSPSCAYSHVLDDLEHLSPKLHRGVDAISANGLHDSP